MSDLVKLFEQDELGELVKQDEFLTIINQEPPKTFVQIHPFNRGVKFIPIDKIELMLTKLFQQWYVEVRDQGQLLNSIFVKTRLHYKHPINGWVFQDGLGAVPAKTEKGSRASDMSSILSDSVMTGLPAAESFAIKDAAEKIGKVFGKDLNRKDTLAFVPSYGTDEVKSEIEKKKKELRDKLSESNK